MKDAVLTFNAGSSSLKFALFTCGASGLSPLFRGQIEALNQDPHLAVRDAQGRLVADELVAHEGDVELSNTAALDHLLRWIDRHDDALRLLAAGHRVVHGGRDLRLPRLIDAGLLKQIEALSVLAPLHQPLNIAPIRALSALRPHLPQVACFDTAFHATMPEVECLLPLPIAMRDLGLRRYGFHGLSYAYIACRLPELLGAQADGRVIVAHLGNGASMCAMRERRSVATTMGFSTLDGLMMGTRCGTLDPGAMLHLIQHCGYPPAQLEHELYRQSGLLGVSGISNDMRTLLASSAPAAAQAVDLYCYRIVRELGALATALGGLDAIVFTAGIGENSAQLRERVLSAVQWLGVDLDAGANAMHGPRLSTATSRVSAWAIPTNEERVVAEATLACLAQNRTDGT